MATSKTKLQPEAADEAVIADVAKPGKVAATPTAKPIIVSNRPILKDPMVVSDDEPAEPKTEVSHVSTMKLESPSTSEVADTANPQPAADETPETATTSPDIQSTEQMPEKSAKLNSKQAIENDEVMLRKSNERAKELEKIIISRKYYLPINQVEKRRNKRYALLGLVLVIVLGLAWLDIALDAGIISIAGVHAPTNFFR